MALLVIKDHLAHGETPGRKDPKDRSDHRVLQALPAKEEHRDLQDHVASKVYLALLETPGLLERMEKRDFKDLEVFLELLE